MHRIQKDLKQPLLDCPGWLNCLTCEIFGINYCKWFKTSPLYNKAAMPKKHCEVGRLLLGEIFKNVLYRLLLGI